MKALCSRDFAENREAESSARQESEDDAALILVQDDRADEELAMKILDSKFKQQSWNRERTQWLGTDPKEVWTKLSRTAARVLYFYFWKKEYPYVASTGTVLHVAGS